MRKFDTKVQLLKYKVLREVARYSWDDTLNQHITDIPKIIVPGKESTMRCCVYKERAILSERIQLAMSTSKKYDNIVKVIDIACDECPSSGYSVTETCRGCLAHRCEDVCPKNAIVFDEHQKAHIDKSLCVNCGKCASVCPYSAITNKKRPCENACKVKAISMSESGSAAIDYNKCISCGACVYQCPFGAVVDRSFITDVIDILNNSDNNQKYKVYAVVAPSISSQFVYAKLGQVVKGIKELGFYHVVEAALGADMVADKEAMELKEKGFLTSSCCPAFVDYIEKSVPKMKEHISHNVSPMTEISKFIKKTCPDAKIVFIGPCTAKKAEIRRANVEPYVDSVITFEELQALFDSKEIDITSLQEDILDNASYFGRIFARSGGLTDAVKQAFKEHEIEDFEAKAIICNGIEDCKKELLKASRPGYQYNFIEGMACVGGCINGAGCLSHGEKNKAEVDSYGKLAIEKTISDAIKVLKI